MCNCLETVSDRYVAYLEAQGVEIDVKPFVECNEYFRGNTNFISIPISICWTQKLKTNKQKTKTVKAKLVPKFCPFCGERY